MKTTIGQGEYSKATNSDGSIVIAFHDYRVDGPTVRRFDSQNAHDLWWGLNAVPKFGLTRRLAAVWARWCDLLALAPEMAPTLQEAMEQSAKDSRSVDIGMLEAVTKMDMIPATAEEPEMPGRVLIDVPAKARAALAALDAELGARADAQARAEEGERAAGWDPNP